MMGDFNAFLLSPRPHLDLGSLEMAPYDFSQLNIPERLMIVAMVMMVKPQMKPN